MHRLRDGDRRFGEAGGDQLELALERGDVTARPHAGQVRAHHLVHHDRALGDLESPVLERSQRGLEPQLQEDGVDLELDFMRLVL